MNQVLSWLLVCGLSYIMFLVRSCPLTISGFPNKMFLRNMMVKVAVQYYPNCGSERIAKYVFPWVGYIDLASKGSYPAGTISFYEKHMEGCNYLNNLMP
ncbi:hypothetical protein H8356DRAFT_1421030 [Neocallimastix lanati (nom. inval.)]|nr:hypothetical protein H8356DRAFT_1421030 [Neocallimastix sp. JGI-2020a]